MNIISSIIATLMGCGLWGFASCAYPTVAHNISVETYATSSPYVTVVTTVNGSTTKSVIPAPYGVATRIVSEVRGGVSSTQATTTPLTQTDIVQMQKNQEAFERRMEAMQEEINRLFAEHQRMFDEMWRSFGDF